VPALINRLHLDDPVWLQAYRRDARQRIADRDAPRDFELALRHRPVPEQLGQRTRHDGVQGIHEVIVTFVPVRLVLASGSPRRAELLRAAGIAFDVFPVDVDEHFRLGEKPEHAVARLAETKATVAAASHPDAVVLGADTTVVIRGEVLAKPVDAADASRMLRLLSGRTHEVLTGVCLWHRGRRLVHVEPTRVRMAQLGDSEIAWYVSTQEPFDKAGGYAVQGLASRFVEGIDGSYSNVVGLPISSVYELLKELGCDILDGKKSQ
jgi:septum formation protein